MPDTTVEGLEVGSGVATGLQCCGCGFRTGVGVWLRRALVCPQLWTGISVVSDVSYSQRAKPCTVNADPRAVSFRVPETFPNRCCAGLWAWPHPRGTA